MPDDARHAPADPALAHSALARPAPGRPALDRPLVDPFGRHIRYLRLSVTDRCDFRCLYCMAEDMTFLPKAEVLSLEELEQLALAFMARGVRKIRLTGGEPLVRRNLLWLIERLGAHVGGALDELTLTTNASQLARFADPLAAAGVRRINVSLDTLDPARFARITRIGRLAPVLEGLEAAAAAGLQVKINTVALKGENEHEVDDLIGFCGANGFDLTLIETMPLGDVGGDRTDHYLPLDAVRADLATRWTLTPIADRTGGPARYVRVEETGRRLGFITPLTGNFCDGCNRVRVTCTGQLYLCLGQEDKADLRAALRGPEPMAALDRLLDEAIGRKPRGHDFVIDHARPRLARHMSTTGG
ncbi:MAG: GTP 3',8-cyclase MoaA [Rhodothalassiaceae bacterium]